MSCHKLLAQLEMHEGFRSKPYKDSVGKLTIGIGRNLDDVGITRQEALVLLENDVQKVRRVLKLYHWYKPLTKVRKRVVIDMAFNLGIKGFLKFKKLIKAIENGNWNMAALEMLDSKWSRQVGRRATRLAIMMRTGRELNESNEPIF